ncbi:MAG: hypothetical protein WA459_22760 [Stellaceae bacterium]
MTTGPRGPVARIRLRSLLAVAIVTAGYLAAAEMVLRFLPVATGLSSVAVSERQPIFHFEPNRRFVYSQGWRLHQVNRGRTNNAGWVNDQDYSRDDPLPLIAVIGDSYIEAAMVSYAQTVQGRLAAALKGRFRVYSVAASGAPLSEFPVYAGYAVREFGARAIVFNIANYDFAESDIIYNAPLGMWVYAGAGNDRRLRLVPYRPGWLRLAVRHSALLRYLVLNLRLDRTLSAARIAGLAPLRSAVAEPAAADAQTARLAAANGVIADFFRDLSRLSGLPADRVLFVMDGFRYPELAAAEKDSDTDRLRQEFRAAAEARGYQTVDLDPIFFERYRQSGSHFEMPGDRHWNGEGHAVAAEGVLSSRLLNAISRP